MSDADSARELPEDGRLHDPDDPHYKVVVASLKQGIELARRQFEGVSDTEQSDDSGPEG